MNTHRSNICRAACFIAVIVGIIYSNSLDSSWHLDDYHNIVKNPWIHIDDLYPETIGKTFFAAYDRGAYTGENVFRPAAMLSFALNWYFHQASVTGYHVTNIVIHAMAGFLLFLSIYTLLDTPNIRQKYGDNRYSIALLASVLWAVHPIQVQAITYIVQRMASMAGMFFIGAVYTYLKARGVSGWFKKAVLLLATLLLYFLASACKENAVILPLLILIIEFLFFQNIEYLKVRKRAWILLGTSCLFFAVVSASLFFSGDMVSILEKYSHRGFTLSERLMTEARVVLFYLNQLIYPVPSNFSIAHDFTLSTSLVSPWTTLPSLLILIGGGTAAILFAHRIPVLSFAVLFYLSNHLIESSIIPLELVFEHRNYIPSMFLFVPLAAVICRMFDTLKHQKKHFLLYTYGVMSAGMIMVVGLGTYTRNFDWRTEKSLWEDAMKKAPGSARPLQNLAILHYRQIGDYDKVIALLTKSLDLTDSKPEYTRMLTYFNLSLAFKNKNDTETALTYAKKGRLAYPSDIATKKYIVTLSAIGMPGKAALVSEQYLKKWPQDENILEIKTISALQLKEYQVAADTALRLMKKEPFNLRYMMLFGLSHSGLKQFKKADYYLEKVASAKTYDQLSTYLALIDNSNKAGFHDKTRRYMKRLFLSFSIHDILHRIETISDEKHSIFGISHSSIMELAGSYVDNAMDIKREKLDENLGAISGKTEKN